MTGRFYAAAVLVSLAVFGAFLPAVNNGFVNWDDIGYYILNPNISSFSLQNIRTIFSGPYCGFWTPLTWLSFAVDHALWGANPKGPHLTNVMLHAANTLLLILLIRQLLQAYGENRSIYKNQTLLLVSCVAGGFLFGLHPLRVESVAWVSERKDVLSGFFFFAALTCYCRYGNREARSPRPIAERLLDRWYGATFLFFAASLMSKPIAVTLPLVLLIIDWYPLSRWSGSGRSLSITAEKLPFFILAAFGSIMTLKGTPALAMVTLDDVTPWSRCLVAAKALIVYPVMMLWPVRLSPLYEHPGNVSLLDPAYGGSFLLVLIITVFCWRTRNRQPYWATVWGYYVVTLLPVLGLLQNGPQELADRFTYLPSAGLTLLTVACGGHLWQRLSLTVISPTILRLSAFGIAVAVAGTYTVSTVRQIAVWQNTETMWGRAIAIQPDNVGRAYAGRANYRARIGRKAEALEDLGKTIEILHRKGYRNLDEHLAKRAHLFAETGHLEEALADYNEAIRLDNDEPLYYAGRGDVLERLGRHLESAADLTTSLKLNKKGSLATGRGGE